MNIKNLAHSSNFFFGTTLFNSVETSYNIQECNLPGISFSHIETSKGSVFGNLQGDTPTYDILNISIIVDEKLEIWKDIVNTLQTMRDPKNGTSEMEFGNSWLEIFDDGSTTVLKLNFVDCIIESIGELSFNTTDEDNIITLPVSIKYDYFTIE